MPAPRGNQFWKLRSTHGADKVFACPDALWKCACTYFRWVDAHPLQQEKVYANGAVQQVALHRPYTLSGLCLYLGINRTTFSNYRREDSHKAFWPVAERIADVIYTQKFEGAVAGLFNPVIIARDLGLADRTEQQHSGEVKQVFKIGDTEIEF